MTYIKHILGEFDEEGKIQRCIICGEIIHDYRGAMYAPEEDGSIIESKGWAEGDFYMSTGNPSYMTSREPDTANIILCK